MKLSESQNFANALRECLGLSPLYGPVISYAGVPSYEETGSSRSDDWFVSGGDNGPMSREEYRSVGVARARSKRQEQNNTVRKLERRLSMTTEERRALDEGAYRPALYMAQPPGKFRNHQRDDDAKR